MERMDSTPNDRDWPSDRFLGGIAVMVGLATGLVVTDITNGGLGLFAGLSASLAYGGIVFRR